MSMSMLVLGVAAGCNRNETPKETPAAKMTNDDLDRSVSAKLNSDVTLASYKIKVDADADKNAVTLSGSVPTENLRTKAVELAKMATPNLVVTDKIDVKPGDIDRKDYTEEMARDARVRAKETGETVGDSIDDAWIHTKIRTRLLGEGEFPGTGINVDVNKNVVTLRGTVSSTEDKAKAEQIAKTTDGVKTVKNQLVVKK
jgi:osmotically-inducible protein OsmY